MPLPACPDPPRSRRPSGRRRCRRCSPRSSYPTSTADEVMSVPMYAGNVATGDESLPGPVVHVPPQTGGVELGAAAKPLNDAGAPPPGERVEARPLRAPERHARRAGVRGGGVAEHECSARREREHDRRRRGRGRQVVRVAGEVRAQRASGPSATVTAGSVHCPLPRCVGDRGARLGGRARAER